MMPSSDRGPLALWIYGTHIATLSGDESGRLALAWTDAAYDRWGVRSRVVSHLLPVTNRPTETHPARVKVFIDGLLPEGHTRTNYAFEAGLRSEDTFGLIARYGRDTAGALVFQPLGAPEPVRIGHYVPLSEREVADRLREAERFAPPHADGRGLDSSTLAGLQPKIVLHHEDGRWLACLDGAPSTWILKLAHPANSPCADVIDTEVLSLDLARASGLRSARARIVSFDGMRAIAVERYDRHRGPAGLERSHQEDLAQAIGANTEDPARKFQRGNRSPSLQQAAQVLRDGGSDPDDLLRLVTFNYLIGNIDAHAKNISFLRHPDGTATLAPAYDTAMHLHHEMERPWSALDINSKFVYADIAVDDVIGEGRSWGLAATRAVRIVRDQLEATREALRAVDLAAYSGVSEDAVAVVAGRLPGGLAGGASGPGAQARAQPPRSADGVWVEPHQRHGRAVPGYYRRRPHR
jgi:serine/threonine-protein kinase HipA